MPNYCPFPGCKRIADKTGMCIGHRIYADQFPTAIIKDQLKPKGIKKVADKRKALNVELAKIVKRIKKERPACEMKVPGICKNKTVTIHHTKGRIGKLLLEEKYMMAACSDCNIWVESHHSEAVEMGLKVSRLNKV